MAHRTIFLLLGSLLLPHYAKTSLSDLIRFENDGGDVLKPKQPLLAARDGRFIRFDTSDTEIELELGVAVPFLKIPLKASAKGTSENSGDHRLTINPAGLLVGATIFFTSFLLIPWLLPTGKRPIHRYASKSDGDGGREGGEVENGAWGLIKEVDQLLTVSKLDPRSCPQKVLCMLGHQFSTTTPSVFDNLLRFDAVKHVGGAYLINAIKSGSCEEAYPTCFLTPHTMTLLPQLLGIW